MPHYTCDQHFIFFDWSLSQPIPCLMQAKSWSGQRLWDQVGGTSAFPTGLPVPLIPWLMQVRSWGVDPMDCLRYSSCPSASEIGNISIFNWSLCANQFPIPSPTQTRIWGVGALQCATMYVGSWACWASAHHSGLFGPVAELLSSGSGSNTHSGRTLDSQALCISCTLCYIRVI